MSQQLTSVARELHIGGSELTETAKGLDDRTASAIEEINDTEQSIDEVQESVDAIADTMQPLQGAAERVGRFTDRLPSRRR
jgi:methyl-accepting chemotaxis protein